jgi:hypothetical protein
MSEMRFAMGGFFVGAVLALNLVYLASVALCARALSLGVIEYALGMGPLLLRRGSLSVRLLPHAAWFNPASRRYPYIEADSELGAALAKGRLRYFEDLPFVASVGMMLISVVVAFIGTAACLGWAVAPEATLVGLRSYVAGALRPMSTGQHLLDAAFADYSHVGGLQFTGHLLAVLGGVNLFWLPSSIMFLLGAIGNRAWLRARFLLWLVARAAEVSWTVAFVSWALG